MPFYILVACLSAMLQVPPLYVCGQLFDLGLAVMVGAGGHYWLLSRMIDPLLDDVSLVLSHSQHIKHAASATSAISQVKRCLFGVLRC